MLRRLLLAHIAVRGFHLESQELEPQQYSVALFVHGPPVLTYCDLAPAVGLLLTGALMMRERELKVQQRC